ncbi:hypothetical protein P7266_0369 [Lactococcus cremoris]|nr:hypothetical protein P7266_0369 [Lactococcus cremoris]
MGFLDKLGNGINNKIDDRKQAKTEKAAYFAENDMLIKSLSKTGKAGSSDYSDEQQIIVLKPSGFGKAHAVKYHTLQSVRINEQILDITKTETKSKGKEKRKGVLGRAVVGTVIMPGVGTVVGAATAKKKKTGKENTTSTTTQEVLRTLIITRDAPFANTIVMPFSDSLLNKINSIIDANKEPVADSTGNELDNLIKLKSLLDAGVLTQEEFDKKKEQFLN